MKDPRKEMETRLCYCLGDWVGPENPKPMCRDCETHHEEPLLMLMVLTDWNCVQAESYMRKSRELAWLRVKHTQNWDNGYAMIKRLMPFQRRWSTPNRQESDQSLIDRLMKFDVQPWKNADYLKEKLRQEAQLQRMNLEKEHESIH